jgi:endonuclease-8
MPEGPEVTYLTKMLNDELQGKQLSSVTILKGRYKNHGAPNKFDEFTTALPLKCKYVEKKGKVIFMYFEKDWCIVSKLGMTGWWYNPNNKPTWGSMYPNIVFSIRSAREKALLYYADFRNYGTLTFYKGGKDVDDELKKLAPDILSPLTTYRVFKKQVANLTHAQRKWLIEDAVIDQKIIVSGIGNYLKSEILYDSRISPLRTIDSISSRDWYSLFTSMKKMTKRMMAAIESNDERVYMSQMHVYHKKNDAFGNDVHLRESKHGRMTYWVPKIQR